MKNGRKQSKKYSVLSKVFLDPAPLLQWRARRKFSQRRAASVAGVSLPLWQRAEYGITSLQLVSASRIAEAIGIDLEKLRTN
jgi:transcriptional regulator with XRE-family HTH domain